MSKAVPITAYWETAPGVPAVGLANVPTVRIRRLDTNALEVTDAAMTEVGDGNYVFSFAPAVDGIEYSVRADGDPTAVAQVPATHRFQAGQVDNKLAETHVRFDLDPNEQQQYNDDGLIILNPQFTLTKTPNVVPAGTFDIVRS
jgi:hypothetical protein